MNQNPNPQTFQHLKLKYELRSNSFKFPYYFLTLTSERSLGNEKHTVSFQIFMQELRFTLVTKILDAVNKILDFIPDQPVSVHQIVCKTKLHTNTVNSYLEIIEKIQSSKNIKKIVQKSRVLFVRE